MKLGACTLSNVHILAELDLKEKSLAETVQYSSATGTAQNSIARM